MSFDIALGKPAGELLDRLDRRQDPFEILMRQGAHTGWSPMLLLIFEARPALVGELVDSDEARCGARECLPQRTHSVERLRSRLERREGGGGHDSSLSEGRP